MTIQPARRISQVVVPLRASQSCSSLWLSLCWPASFFSRLSLMSFRVLSLRSCLCCRVSSSYRRSRSKNWQTEQYQNEEITQTLKELTDRTVSKWGDYAAAQRTDSQNSIKMRRRIRRRSKNWRTEQHQNEKENTQTLKELTDRAASKWEGEYADAQRTDRQNSIKMRRRLRRRSKN